jgi:hypothetical protein
MKCLTAIIGALLSTVAILIAAIMGLFIAIAYFPVSVYVSFGIVFLLVYSQARQAQFEEQPWYRAFISEKKLPESICNRCQYGHMMCFTKQESIPDWETRTRCSSYKK